MGVGVSAVACFLNHPSSVFIVVLRYFTVVLKLDPARLYATYFGGKSPSLWSIVFCPVHFSLILMIRRLLPRSSC